VSQRRALTKAELQKMILQVMYELKYGKMSTYASGMDSIIPYWINEYFSIQLTPAEKMLAKEAVEDLKNSGLITQDPAKEEEVFQVLTQKGKEALHGKPEPAPEPENPKTQPKPAPEAPKEAPKELQIKDVITNPELLDICRQDFNGGDYKTAVLFSFRLLETKTDAAAQLGGKDLGTVLMAKAFSPFMGKLSIAPEAGIEVQDGVLNLFGGAVAVFAHKQTELPLNLDDRRVALKVIVFVELLLDILSKAQLKSQTP
jgi:hypothetical protein